MKEGKVRGEERMGGSKQRGRKEERRERGRNNCYAVRMDQLMYHSCNLILLPSSSIVLILKSTPGEPEGEKRGTMPEELVAINQDGLKIGLLQTQS